MENKMDRTPLRHPDYDRELTELIRSALSPKAFREKLLDYHEKRHCRRAGNAHAR